MQKTVIITNVDFDYRKMVFLIYASFRQLFVFFLKGGAVFFAHEFARTFLFAFRLTVSTVRIHGAIAPTGLLAWKEVVRCYAEDCWRIAHDFSAHRSPIVEEGTWPVAVKRESNLRLRVLRFLNGIVCDGMPIRSRTRIGTMRRRIIEFLPQNISRLHSLQ